MKRTPRPITRNDFCETELWQCRVKPIIHPLLSKEQAGFRRKKLTEDQFVLLFNTGDIKDPFKGKKKDGVVILTLTDAYDSLALWPYL